MQFGVFDHVDCSDVSISEHLENRLKYVEAYDRCGMYGYHVAEHHGTPLGYAPSPSLLIAAASQRTKRLRLGALVYLLPLYHPLRLIEEVAMLDHLTRGRLMLGVGRGVSPIEAGFFGVPAEEQAARYEEALDIVLEGLQHDTLTFEGKFHKFKNVPVTMRPVQHPYPELWYGVSKPETVRWAAQRGINVVTLALDENVRAMTDLYRKEWASLGNGPETLPLMGVSRHIVVAETDAEAKDIARSAYQRWRDSFGKLWVDAGFPVPAPGLYPETWDALEALNNGCAGSPETVKRFALEEARRGGFNYLVSWFAFGNMTPDQVLTSVTLFSQFVMPAFKEAGSGAVR